ncbi:hypothetical protein ACUN0C_07390 [Faunimonas sp. B44]|uniref:hypothetical protein n=1 Tax=Faunimonas sp. B44 TaxID=3461493 RepID=UPI004044062A
MSRAAELADAEPASVAVAEHDLVHRHEAVALGHARGASARVALGLLGLGLRERLALAGALAALVWLAVGLVAF